MRRNIGLIIVALTACLLAEEQDSTAVFTAREPILLTSAGQNADLLMVKILAEKQELEFTMEKLVTADQLEGYATLIIVSGGSTKGLGAAKIDREEELARVMALIAAAKEQQVPILTMHMGGKARRGKLSDFFNAPAAENADCLIVVKSGDEDQFFSIIAADRKIPLFLIDKIMAAGALLQDIFR